jgi:hypothetical protein
MPFGSFPWYGTREENKVVIFTSKAGVAEIGDFAMERIWVILGGLEYQNITRFDITMNYAYFIA